MRETEPSARCKPAFTLIELLVIIAIIAILAALLFPCLSKGKQRAQGVVCLNEGKQLMLAMTMYTAGYHDFVPPNPDDGNGIPGHKRVQGQGRKWWRQLQAVEYRIQAHGNGAHGVTRPS